MIFHAYPDAKTRQVLWQTIQLASISTHIDYHWQTINYNRRYCHNHYHRAQRPTQCSISQWCPQNNSAQQVKTVHLLFNTSKFYKTVVLDVSVSHTQILVCLLYTSVAINILKENNCVKKNNNKTKIKEINTDKW